MNPVVKILAVLGALSVAAAIGGCVVLFTMVRHGFSAREEPSPMEARLATSMRAWSSSTETRSLVNPVPDTLEAIAMGRAHWADHCFACHANDGSGDTGMGRNLYPRAPDMRLAGTQRLTDGELYSIIENGIRLTGMPAWGDGGHQNDGSWALVRFIRHLPRITPQELEEMKSLNPKSPDEYEEELQEKQFIDGDAADGGVAPPKPAMAPMPNMSHGGHK
jgi:mono/diheme cytochrome c family protein